MTKNSRPGLELADLQGGAIPQHVAIIMDGNGRWAQARRRPRLLGHRSGVKSVQAVVKAAGELGVKVLTLYAFSEENWGRPEEEVSGLMSMLDTYIVREKKELDANNVRLMTIGRTEALPKKTQKLLHKTIAELAKNDGLILNIALSYGSQGEIVSACQQIAQKVKDGALSPSDIDAAIIADHLGTKGLPNPDLLIRTSGEQRLSNFLLWQISYSELLFSQTLWPDFGREEFFAAIQWFQGRKRRFGLVDNTTLTSNELKEVPSYPVASPRIKSLDPSLLN